MRRAEAVAYGCMLAVAFVAGGLSGRLVGMLLGWP